MSEEIYPNDDPATGPDAAAAADAAAPQEAAQPAAQGRYARLTSETGGVRKLTGMYKNWFLDYASYVILERAVPHVGDGLKPVQRRILHAMKVIDDGRYNKVANIVQTDPVRIVFSVTDKEMLNLRQDYDKRGGEVYSKIILANGKVIKKPILSRFNDNSINTGTATMSVYSEFENKDDMLIPGGYVDIMIGSGPEKNAVVISQAALAQDEHGNYVMIVNKDNVVEQRRITLGEIADNRQIVTSGLKAGEKVIIQGLQKVSDGKKVRTGTVNEQTTEGK